MTATWTAARQSQTEAAAVAAAMTAVVAAATGARTTSGGVPVPVNSPQRHSEHAAHALLLRFPTLLLFLLAAYGAPAYITALGPDGWVHFLSRRGCTQGCPLGPLCHAAGLQEAIERVHHGFLPRSMCCLRRCTMMLRLQGRRIVSC